MENRGLLKEFKELIISLNKVSPDIAAMDLTNNKDASARAVRGLKSFKKNDLEPFIEKVLEARKQIVSK